MRDGTKVAACRDALRVTIVAICDYCGTDRPNLSMVSKLYNLAEVIDDPEGFKEELDKLCGVRLVSGEPSKLTVARDALKEYIDSTECNLCKANAIPVMRAVEELIGLHERGWEFARYFDEDCVVLKLIMEDTNGKRETSNREDG